jgi:RecG-like helicase
MGTQQSGEIPLKVTNLIGDSRLIQKIRKLVERIIQKDPKLKNINNAIILENLKNMIDKKDIWEYIS